MSIWFKPYREWKFRKSNGVYRHAWIISPKTMKKDDVINFLSQLKKMRPLTNVRINRDIEVFDQKILCALSTNYLTCTRDAFLVPMVSMSSVEESKTDGYAESEGFDSDFDFERAADEENGETNDFLKPKEDLRL